MVTVSQTQFLRLMVKVDVDEGGWVWINGSTKRCLFPIFKSMLVS